MQSILLIAPDFLIIVLGAAAYSYLKYPQIFWQWAEKLVFYILFPPLLLISIATSRLSVSQSSEFLAAGLATMSLGVVLAWSVRYVVRADQVTHASVFQCGFRFNTYIGFALCSRLFGEEGFALLALIMAFWVPVSNTIAVAVLAFAVARRDAARNTATGSEVNAAQLLRSTLAAVIRNPLIIATLCGLGINVSGIALPQVAVDFMRHLGSASLAMGLLCIGAGLRLKGMRGSFKLLAASSFVRLVAISVVAVVMIHLFDLSPLAAGVLLIFTSLPTGQSCYVMTANMRGDAAAVANITTVQTVAAMATLPAWIAAFIL